MSDPDGLTERQRVLVNDAYQAIVPFSAMSITARAHPDADIFGYAQARQRSNTALRAARDAGVPARVLENTITTALTAGRHAAGA